MKHQDPRRLPFVADDVPVSDPARQPAARRQSPAQQQQQRPSICFVSPAAYPVLARSKDLPFVGGAEVQQSLIASELARRGHDVTMICMDVGQREGEVIDGVRVLKMHAPLAGVPGLRFWHPRLTSLLSAMRRADADIYYHRTRGMTIGIVAAFGRRYSKASVYAVAHDRDFNAGPDAIRYARDRALFRWGMRRVDRIIVQTARQHAMCMQEYGRDAVVIDSCIAHCGRPAAHDGDVLWVATAKRYKQPHLFLELAARLPQFRFRLVGGPERSAAERRYFDDLRGHAAALPNVTMTGFVPYADVEQQFDGASVFVNTSVGEGFPNTFLQAWSRGMPTVSFFDPLSTLDGQPVAGVAGDLNDMAQRVLALKADPLYWREMGERARQLVARRHSIGSVGDAYERLFAGLAAAGAS